MDKRREPRMKKRIACALWIKGVRQHGIVLDVSSKGLFVQTSAKPQPARSEPEASGAPRAGRAWIDYTRRRRLSASRSARSSPGERAAARPPKRCSR